MIELTTDLGELDDLLGHVAAAANHAHDPRLERRLDAVYQRLAALERGAVSLGRRFRAVGPPDRQAGQHLILVTKFAPARE